MAVTPDNLIVRKPATPVAIAPQVDLSSDTPPAGTLLQRNTLGKWKPVYHDVTSNEATPQEIKDAWQTVLKLRKQLGDAVKAVDEALRVTYVPAADDCEVRTGLQFDTMTVACVRKIDWQWMDAKSTKRRRVDKGEAHFKVA